MNKKPIKKTANAKLPEKLKICLLGFMGAGKTATAQMLAQMLAAECVDLDEIIELRENRRVAQIFENLGEKVFREVESEALCEVIERFPASCIIALGGGAWTIPANREMLRVNGCRTIWLDAPFELCWKRIVGAGEIRPLARDRQAALILFNERRKIYQTAEIHVSVNGRRTAASIANEVIQEISEIKPRS